MEIFYLRVCSDEFKGHSLLQAAREADIAKAKKSLALEIINFKHPHTHETALVRLAPIPHVIIQRRQISRLMFLSVCVCVCVLALCGSIASP